MSDLRRCITNQLISCGEHSVVNWLSIFGSSYWRCSIRKGVLRNFIKLIGKHLCQSLFFNNVAGLSHATLLKKRLRQRSFSVHFAKFLRTPFVQNTSEWLLLVFASEKTFPKSVTEAFANWSKFVQRDNIKVSIGNGFTYWISIWCKFIYNYNFLLNTIKCCY